jgi:Na+/proline symporter
MAFLFLPRQFQVAVVENVNEAHLKRAAWLFPLYLLLINIFVLPIALGGLLHFAGQGVDADTLVLTLPMSQRQEGLTLLVFIGGLSAATGMVIVETIALSTMVCNDLVMPLLIRHKRVALDRVQGPLAAAYSASGVAPSWSSCCSATSTSGWPARLTHWWPSA